MQTFKFFVERSLEPSISGRLAGHKAELGLQLVINYSEVAPTNNGVSPQKRQGIVSAYSLHRRDIGLESISPAP
jgi:hypothetical protein